MTEGEAVVIGDYLNRILKPGLKVLDIGSSTHSYRTTTKPHINKEIYQRILNRGCSITSIDYKSGEGVDISGDIFSTSIQKKISDEGGDVLLCNNLAEHVEDKEGLLKILSGFEVKYIIFSVPFDYPYHQDPIDNLYRPNERELAQAFPNYQNIRSQTVASITFWDALKKLNPPVAVFRIGKEFFRVCYWILTLKFKHIRYSRLFWLIKPYRTTVALYEMN